MGKRAAKPVPDSERRREWQRTLLGIVVVTAVVLGAWQVWRLTHAPSFPADVIAMDAQTFAHIDGKGITPPGAPVGGVLRGQTLFLYAGDGTQVPAGWQPGERTRSFRFVLQPAPATHTAAARVDLAALGQRLGAGPVDLTGPQGTISVMLP